MLRFVFLFLFLASIFGSCTLPGTQDESGIVEENTVNYSDDQITMRIPKTWSGKTHNLPTPRIGVIVAAFVSPEAKYGFANNLLILSDSLGDIMTSRRYSELNNAQTKKNYYEYSSLKEEDMIFDDSELTRVYVFEAKYNETTPKMKFIQTARVCGSRVYLLHFTLSLEKKSENYIALLKTFTCKSSSNT